VDWASPAQVDLLMETVEWSILELALNGVLDPEIAGALHAAAVRALDRPGLALNQRRRAEGYLDWLWSRRTLPIKDSGTGRAPEGWIRSEWARTWARLALEPEGEQRRRFESRLRSMLEGLRVDLAAGGSSEDRLGQAPPVDPRNFSPAAWLDLEALVEETACRVRAKSSGPEGLRAAAYFAVELGAWIDKAEGDASRPRLERVWDRLFEAMAAGDTQASLAGLPPDAQRREKLLALAVAWCDPDDVRAVVRDRFKMTERHLAMLRRRLPAPDVLRFLATRWREGDAGTARAARREVEAGYFALTDQDRQSYRESLAGSRLARREFLDRMHGLTGPRRAILIEDLLDWQRYLKADPPARNEVLAVVEKKAEDAAHRKAPYPSWYDSSLGVLAESEPTRWAPRLISYCADLKGIGDLNLLLALARAGGPIPAGGWELIATQLDEQGTDVVWRAYNAERERLAGLPALALFEMLRSTRAPAVRYACTGLLADRAQDEKMVSAWFERLESDWSSLRDWAIVLRALRGDPKAAEEVLSWVGACDSKRDPLLAARLVVDRFPEKIRQAGEWILFQATSPAARGLARHFLQELDP
jgi:hypothetical protein